MSEAIKQKTGFKQEQDYQKGKSGIAKYALNERNADLLQKSFRKMRGAALKIGQVMSTSEDSVMPPVIRDAMEKARSSADIMPVKQVVRIFEKTYGPEWQKKFKEINLYPFAAASIGQVHEAILHDGTRVALKIQYTGVANSIDSDLDNFKLLIDVLGVFPRGLFLEEAIKVTREELHNECDYEREATYQTKYRNSCIVSPQKFYTPKVIDDMSTKEILVTEFVDGVEIDTLGDLSQEVRNRVGALMLELCFRELFEWKVMQTDPNPANYLYDLEKQRINLLDFGAGRDFDTEFLDKYIEIIHGAYTTDREKIMKNSLSAEFLTGEENKLMMNTHYEGVMIVGEPFRTSHSDALYDFGTADFTEKVTKLLPTLSKHRLKAPPTQIYSLHKKVVGTYLTCIKLKSKVPARRIFEETYENWQRLKAGTPLIPR